MKSSRVAAAAFLISLGLTSVAVSASAQMTTSSPMVVKQTTPKKIWVKAEVIRADSHSIMVREVASERTIHTFTYDTKIQAKMQQVADKGGYKSGDKVKIQYVPGQEVALKVHGRPSKSP